MKSVRIMVLGPFSVDSPGLSRGRETAMAAAVQAAAPNSRMASCAPCALSLRKSAERLMKQKSAEN